jgi:alpha-mannosidase
MRADNGVQKFTYAFYAWEGSFIDSDVVRQGYELNVTPYVTRGRVQTFEALQIDKKNVILETMKPAEDGSGDIILRFYEAAGAAVTSRITINWKAERAWLCDMLEHPREELGIPERGLRLPFGTFEIKTIRLQLSAFPYN